MDYYVFGYGSLIWKPPPHIAERIPGYISGFSRRFAQSSHDHRGTPENPGLVATLVTARDWHELPEADNLPDGDLVWGVTYRIQPEYAKEVKAYLDHREKDGFTIASVDVWNIVNGTQQIVVRGAQTYVGQRENPSFFGPRPLDELAAIIHQAEGPSGKNTEYLFKLHEAVAELCPSSTDVYLDELSKRVRHLESANGSQAAR